MATNWPWAEHFEADGIHFATATVGLPPRATSAAMAEVLDRWRRGLTTAPEFDPIVSRARSTYASLVGVDPSLVAIGNQVSPFVGIIAASLPEGAEVLVPEGEFTSVTFPFAVQTGLRVRQAPLAELAAHVTDDTRLVAVAAVQSASGEVADLAAIEEAAARHHADVLVDTTQAAGWLPIDASRFAFTVCSTYKWLLSPRGTAFLTVRPDLARTLTPAQAGWYAGGSPWDSIYGLPLRLAEDVRRFDVSPAWFSWVGTAASLDFLAEIGRESLHTHALSVEAAFAQAAGLEPAGRAIVSLDADEDVAAILERAGVTASVRAGRLRLAFHVNNTVEEATHIGNLLRGHVRA